MIYRKFKLDNKIYTQLSENERQVLKILENVIQDLASVYEQQLKDGFYPKGATKEQIEEEDKKNPAILAPFTHVSKINGKWEATPFHQKYADLLRPISQKIE